MKKIIFVLGLLMLISNVSAMNITYPDEYYSLKLLADEHVNPRAMVESWDSSTNQLTLNIFYELRRQTILMEKHNELLAEQNHIMWVNTCYGGYGGYILNRSSLKEACIESGYIPVNNPWGLA